MGYDSDKSISDKRFLVKMYTSQTRRPFAQSRIQVRLHCNFIAVYLKITSRNSDKIISSHNSCF